MEWNQRIALLWPNIGEEHWPERRYCDVDCIGWHWDRPVYCCYPGHNIHRPVGYVAGLSGLYHLLTPPLLGRKPLLRGELFFNLR